MCPNLKWSKYVIVPGTDTHIADLLAHLMYIVRIAGRIERPLGLFIARGEFVVSFCFGGYLRPDLGRLIGNLLFFDRIKGPFRFIRLMDLASAWAQSVENIKSYITLQLL